MASYSAKRRLVESDNGQPDFSNTKLTYNPMDSLGRLAGGMIGQNPSVQGWGKYTQLGQSRGPFGKFPYNPSGAIGGSTS